MTEPLFEALRSSWLAAGLSQGEVAERLQVSQATVSNWELGKSEPSRRQIQELESFLGPLVSSKASDSAATTPSDVSPFGVWLNATRVRKSLTVPELAQRAGVSIMTVYNLESGRINNPQERTKEALTRALDSDVSREAAQATQEAANIEGLGSLVDFDPYDEDSLPAVAGVYMFYDISDRPIYVGQSGNIRQRIRNDHVDKFWFKRPIVELGAYVEIKEQKLRGQIEKILIRFLKSNALINIRHVDREEGDVAPKRGRAPNPGATPDANRAVRGRRR
jgi:transcriptional regulator with XRE-family HTH domain